MLRTPPSTRDFTGYTTFDGDRAQPPSDSRSGDTLFTDGDGDHQQPPSDLEQEEENGVTTLPTVSKIPKDSKITGFMIVGGQIGLALVSVGAGLLYWTPSKSCINDEMCGKYLVDLLVAASCPADIAADVSRGILTLSGGAGYDAGAIYFGFEAIPAWIELYQQQKYNSAIWSLIAKTAVVIAVPVLSAISPAAIYIISKNLGEEPLALFGSTGGAAPGSIYATAKTLQAIPRYASNIKTGIQLSYADFLAKYHWELTLSQEVLQHYRDEQNTFNASLYQRWKTLIDIAANIKAVPEANSPFEYLMSLAEKNGDGEHRKLSWLYSALGVALGGFMSTPFIIERYNSFRDEPANEDADFAYHASQSHYGLLSLGLSYAEIIGDMALMTQGVEAAAELIRANIAGEKIESLEFQRYPLRTSVAVSILSFTQVFSYAVGSMVTSGATKDWDKETRDTAMVTMSAMYNVYHMLSMRALWLVLVERFRRNPIDRFLDQVKKSYESHKEMTLHQFITWVEGLDRDKRQEYGLTRYAATPIDEAGKSPATDESERTPLIAGTRQSLFSKASDYLGSCLSGGKKHEEEQLVETPRQSRLGNPSSNR